MNDDASTFEIPEYIHSRLQPQIYLDFPEAEEERRILRENLSFVDEYIMDYVINFLQKAQHFQRKLHNTRWNKHRPLCGKRIKSLSGNHANVDNLLSAKPFMTLGDEATIPYHLIYEEEETFCLQKDNIYGLPIIHYNMEMAAQVRFFLMPSSPIAWLLS